MEGHGLDTPSAKPPGKEAKSRPRAETRRESFEFAPSQGGARPGRPGRSVGRSATLARFVGAIKKLPREMSSQGEGRAGHRGRGQELRHGGGAGGRRGGLADDQSTPGRHRDRGGMPSGGASRSRTRSGRRRVLRRTRPGPVGVRRVARSREWFVCDGNASPEDHVCGKGVFGDLPQSRFGAS